MYFFATAQKSYQPRAAYSFSGGAKTPPLLKKLLKINSFR